MRFFLKGRGDPVSEFALPDAGTDPSHLPLLLNLPHGEPFIPELYTTLGYTHYEVCCIGAAGGRGSDGGGRSGSGSGPVNLALSWPYTTEFTSSGVTIRHWHDPRIDDKHTWGGGGGGGGLHVVSGLLTELPDEVVVVVGQAGVDRGHRQLAKPTTIATSFNDTPSYGNDPTAIYDEPHISFPPQEAGEDGGTSSFNGETCQASGGKGGSPSAYWDSNTLMISGDGGSGGSGGQATAGGGAPGSTTEDTPPDGTWDGTIGKGGGGGRGGSVMSRPSGPLFGV